MMHEIKTLCTQGITSNRKYKYILLCTEYIWYIVLCEILCIYTTSGSYRLRNTMMALSIEANPVFKVLGTLHSSMSGMKEIQYTYYFIIN